MTTMSMPCGDVEHYSRYLSSTLSVSKTKRPVVVCPVTNEQIEVDGACMFLPLRGSQRIIFASRAAAKRFATTPLQFFNTTRKEESKSNGLHQDELNGSSVWDPINCAPLLITSATPRLQVANGQAIFFDSFSNIAAFLQDTMKYFACAPEAVSRNVKCILSGKRLDLLEQAKHPNLANVETNHGQKLFFCDRSEATSFATNPRRYTLTTVPPAAQEVTHNEDSVEEEQEAPICARCYGSVARDPVDNSVFIVGDATPRVVFLNGQQLFFGSYANVDKWLKTPAKFGLIIHAKNGSGTKKEA